MTECISIPVPAAWVVPSQAAVRKTLAKERRVYYYIVRCTMAIRELFGKIFVSREPARLEP